MLQPSAPLSCCCRGRFEFCWISAQIEWFDLCFVVDFFFPKRPITMKSQAVLAALQVAPGHSSSTVYLLKKSKQTLGSTSRQLQPLREGRGAAAGRCSSEGKGRFIPRAEGGFPPAFSAGLQSGTLVGRTFQSVVAGAGAVSAVTAIAFVPWEHLTTMLPGSSQPHGLTEFCSNCTNRDLIQ